MIHESDHRLAVTGLVCGDVRICAGHVACQCPKSGRPSGSRMPAVVFGMVGEHREK